jgi:AcrR family transcriptional regulator
MGTTQRGGDRPAPSVGERILSTASDLFYREGVRAVGIQRVIDAAGIAKASLYAHYASKDDLVAAYLEKQGHAARGTLTAGLDKSGLDARGRLLALFDAQVAMIEGPDFRGCPFLNASSEITDPSHPAKVVIAAQRAWLHGLVEGLAKDAGVASPSHVAGTLVVLFDGALASSLVDGSAAAARHARRAAEQIVDAHLAHAAAPPSTTSIGGRRRDRSASRATPVRRSRSPR